ncbi:MAG: iron-containing alcohol dehydrogenase [Desulfurispora sp.]|uniref:iron-containing alcohol dehydrogenase n=1 Tax=Desulfurispora sp. TaxID=3014275 RepID=UPI00404B1F8E
MSGRDARKVLGHEFKKMGCRVVLVCTEKCILNNGLLLDILDALSRENMAFDVFEDIGPEPDIRLVEEGLKVFRNDQCDALLAVGSSNVLSTARAISAMHARSLLLESLPEWKKSYHQPPVVAVPTYAGTGLEQTLPDLLGTTPQEQAPLTSSPSITVLDPVMLQNLPQERAAWGGLITLTHAIEGYLSTNSFELSDLFNLEAIRQIARYLRRFVASRQNLAAAEAILNASLYTTLGSTNSGLGAISALACTLATEPGINYEQACLTLLLPVLEFNATACPEKMVHIASCFGQPVHKLPEHRAARLAILAIRELIRDLPLNRPICISQSFTRDAIRKLATTAIQHRNMLTNPREVTLADAIKLYNQALTI